MSNPISLFSCDHQTFLAYESDNLNWSALEKNLPTELWEKIKILKNSLKPSHFLWQWLVLFNVSNNNFHPKMKVILSAEIFTLLDKQEVSFLFLSCIRNIDEEALRNFLEDVYQNPEAFTYFYEWMIALRNCLWGIDEKEHVLSILLKAIPFKDREDFYYFCKFHHQFYNQSKSEQDLETWNKYLHSYSIDLTFILQFSYISLFKTFPEWKRKYFIFQIIRQPNWDLKKIIPLLNLFDHQDWLFLKECFFNLTQIKQFSIFCMHCLRGIYKHSLLKDSPDRNALIKILSENIIHTEDWMLHIVKIAKKCVSSIGIKKMKHLASLSPSLHFYLRLIHLALKINDEEFNQELQAWMLIDEKKDSFSPTTLLFNVLVKLKNHEKDIFVLFEILKEGFVSPREQEIFKISFLNFLKNKNIFNDTFFAKALLANHRPHEISRFKDHLIWSLPHYHYSKLPLTQALFKQNQSQALKYLFYDYCQNRVDFKISFKIVQEYYNVKQTVLKDFSDWIEATFQLDELKEVKFITLQNLLSFLNSKSINLTSCYGHLEKPFNWMIQDWFKDSSFVKKNLIISKISFALLNHFNPRHFDKIIFKIFIRECHKEGIGFSLINDVLQCLDPLEKRTKFIASFKKNLLLMEGFNRLLEDRIFQISDYFEQPLLFDFMDKLDLNWRHILILAIKRKSFFDEKDQYHLKKIFSNLKQLKDLEAFYQALIIDLKEPLLERVKKIYREC